MNRYAPCPNCSACEATEIGFTWWGGVVGPKMFHHVKCSKCGTTYNGKTGKSNQQAIAIYLAVSAIIGIAIVTIFRPQTSTSPSNSWLLPGERHEREV
jgi:transposase-like protein